MALSNITVAGLTPALSILGDYQRFIYIDNVASFQLDNTFVPIISIPSQTNSELRNNTLSGYRFIHSTLSTDTIGTFKLQSFVSASPTGTDIWEIAQDGSLDFLTPVTFTGGIGGITITLGGAVTGSGSSSSTITTTLTPITVSQITDYITATEAFRLDQFAIPVANVNFNNENITNLANPVNAQDAATKNYVDAVASGGTIVLTGAITGSGVTGTPFATTLNSSQNLTADFITFTYPNDLSSNHYGFVHVLDSTQSTYYWTEDITNSVGDHFWHTQINPIDVTYSISFYNTGTGAYTVTPLSIVSLGGTSAITLDAIVSLNTHRITDVVDPTNPQDAATKAYVDSAISGDSITLTGAVTGSGSGTINTTLTPIIVSQITDYITATEAFRLDQFAAPTANINLNTNKIINLVDPTNPQDAATKNYVDTAISGGLVTLSGSVIGSGDVGTTISTVFGPTQTLASTTRIITFNYADNATPTYGNIHQLNNTQSAYNFGLDIADSTGLKYWRTRFDPISTTKSYSVGFYDTSSGGTTVIPLDISVTSGIATVGIHSILSMNTNKITNVVDPTLSSDAATKNYIDSIRTITLGGAVTSAATTLGSTINTILGGTQTPDVSTPIISFTYQINGTSYGFNQKLLSTSSSSAWAQTILDSTSVKKWISSFNPNNGTYFISHVDSGGTAIPISVTASGTTTAVVITGLTTLGSSTFGGNLAMGGYNITGLNDPALTQDAATKNYVDTRTITLAGAVTSSATALGSTVTTTLGATQTLTSSSIAFIYPSGNSSFTHVLTGVSPVWSETIAILGASWNSNFNPTSGRYSLQYINLGTPYFPISVTIVSGSIAIDLIGTVSVNNNNITTLADAVNPQDAVNLRTFMNTTRSSGMCYMQSNATSTPNASFSSGGYAKIAGTTSSSNLVNFTMSTSNRLQYTGSSTITVLVTLIVSCEFGGTTSFVNSVRGIAIYQDGVQIIPSLVRINNINNTTPNANPQLSTLTTQTITTMATNDYVEGYVFNSAAGATAMAEELTLIVTTI